MKDYHIYIFDNLENLNKTVGFVNIKEQFINNSFVEESYVLISLSEDLTYRKEIPLKYIQKNLVKGQGFSVPQYGLKYSKQIQSINSYVDNHGTPLSWLEIFQIAILIYGNEDINERIINQSINDLTIFRKIIKDKY